MQLIQPTQIFIDQAELRQNGHTLEEMIGREGFGADETPDLLFVNYKMIDYISHVWTVNSPEMQIMGHLPCLPEARG